MRDGRSWLVASALSTAALAAPAATLSFDDLATPPTAIEGLRGLYYANGDSDSYGGVVWDRSLSIGNAQFRVQTIPEPGPLFGIPHSGNYYLTNQGNGITNDGMLLTTTLVLTGAWFGRNEYYGFGGGASSVTVYALHGSTVLGSVTRELPEDNPAQPEPLVFMDTGAFIQLSGITGYRIDRVEFGTQSGNWVGDDFSFTTAVPEPNREMLLLIGLAVTGWAARRRLAA